MAFSGPPTGTGGARRAYVPDRPRSPTLDEPGGVPGPAGNGVLRRFAGRRPIQPLAFLAAIALVGSAAAADALRDPTRPWQAPPVAPAGVVSDAPLRLSAVIVSGERRIALIDDRVLRVGDRHRAATVVAIADDAVWIEIEGQRRRLALAGRSNEGIRRTTEAGPSERETDEDR
jgi:hypothetical protein